MGDTDFTQNTTDVHQERISSADFRRASERQGPDGLPDAEEGERMMRMLEEALDKERTRLMAANSMLGCLQTALDPEAIEASHPLTAPSTPTPSAKANSTP
jgi:hypothetical protein